MADVITMLINSAVSFWVFFPIFRIIFKIRRLKRYLQKPAPFLGSSHLVSAFHIIKCTADKSKYTNG